MFTTETQSHRDLNIKLTEAILGAAIAVHKHLGPGLLETIYEGCLCWELGQRQLSYRRQLHVPIIYKGLELGCEYRLDVLVEDHVVLELKSVDQIQPVHEAQLLTYLKITGKRLGLLINFNVPILKKGIVRRVI